jgi:hypothetical protein
MEFLMDKVIRDGKVAVLVSRGFGAGWSTWGGEQYHETLLFHPKLIEMVEEGREREITDEWMEKELGLEDVYTGGTDGLCIEWVPVGTKFVIHEYDGHESLKTIDDFYWMTA